MFEELNASIQEEVVADALPRRDRGRRRRRGSSQPARCDEPERRPERLRSTSTSRSPAPTRSRPRAAGAGRDRGRARGGRRLGRDPAARRRRSATRSAATTRAGAAAARSSSAATAPRRREVRLRLRRSHDDFARFVLDAQRALPSKAWQRRQRAFLRATGVRPRAVLTKTAAVESPRRLAAQDGARRRVASSHVRGQTPDVAVSDSAVAGRYHRPRWPTRRRPFRSSSSFRRSGPSLPGSVITFDPDALEKRHRRARAGDGRARVSGTTSSTRRRSRPSTRG